MTKKIKNLRTIILIALTVTAAFAFNITAVLAQDNPLIPHQQGTSSEKLAIVQNLPKGNWADVIATVIKTMLQIAGALSVAAFTVGGVFMITAQGNPEKLKKGQGIILWSVVALIIMAVAYAIVLGVSQLKFFG